MITTTAAGRTWHYSHNLGRQTAEHNQSKFGRTGGYCYPMDVAYAGNDILFVGELRGGPDDNEELYCPTIEWDWGDDTISENTLDCDPFEAGVSEIRRRFSVRHTFDYPGRYEVRLHLKRQDDVLISARTRIEVRGQRFR